MYRESMKKQTAPCILLALVIVVFPLYAGGISAPPGLTQPVADSLYVNVSGDTVTGNFAVEGDTTLGNAVGDGVQANAGTWTFPSNTEFDNAGKFIQLTGGLKVNASSTFFSNLTIEGATIVGNAVSDQFQIFAGSWFIENATTATIKAALVLDATGQKVSGKGTWEFLNDCMLYGDAWLGFLDTDTVTINAGIVNYESDTVVTHDGEIVYNLNDLTTFDATGESPVMKAITWDFTASTNVTVPDADAATEAMNQQTSDARYIQTRSPIVVMFGGGTDPHADTSNATYTSIGVFLFGGTTDLGTPSAVSVTGFKDVNPTFWEWRLLDITNATTIAEVTGNTGTVPEISTDSSLTNLPAAAALFDLQLRRAGGIIADEVHAHSLNIDF